MQKAGIGENPISAYICFGYKDKEEIFRPGEIFPKG